MQIFIFSMHNSVIFTLLSLYIKHIKNTHKNILKYNQLKLFNNKINVINCIIFPILRNRVHDPFPIFSFYIYIFAYYKEILFGSKLNKNQNKVFLMTYLFTEINLNSSLIL